MSQVSSDPTAESGSVQRVEVALDDAPGRAGAGRPDDSLRPFEQPWSLAASHLLLPLAAVGMGLVAGVGHAWFGLFAPVAVAVAGVVVARATTKTSAPAVGVAGWLGAASTVASAVVLVSNGRQWSLLAGLATVAGVGVVDLFLWVASAGPDRPVRRAALIEAWHGAFDPPRALPAWIVGAGIGLPLLALYAPMITESDSAWIVVSTDRVRDEGVNLLQQTQDVFLPHAVIGPLLRIGGYPLANAFAAVAVIALLALASVFSQWLTRRAVGAFAGALTLLAMPETVERADRLPMYAIMLICGYAGGWLIHRAMSDPPGPRWWAAVGGAGLVVAFEAHSVGQLFILVPFLLLILHPFGRAWRPFALAVATMVVAAIPRIVVNYSVDGFDRFRSNYTDWLIQNGYLRAVNEEFWGQRVSGSPIDYLANVPSMATKAFGIVTVVLCIGLAVMAARSARTRTTVFCTASAGIYLLALTVASPGTYARYLTPLSVGMAVVAAVGVVRLVDGTRAMRRVGGAVVAVLAVVSLVNITTDARDHQQLVHRVLPDREALTALIGEGEGVLGVRSHDLLWADPDLRTEFSRTMTEEDFTTYLTWPSDEAVVRMMQRLGVQYIVLSPKPYIEYDYHETWLRRFFGAEDNHDRVRTSPWFCQVSTAGGYELYRLGACPGPS